MGSGGGGGGGQKRSQDANAYLSLLSVLKIDLKRARKEKWSVLTGH